RNNQNVNGSGTFNNRAGATFLRSTAMETVRVAPRVNNDGIVEMRTGSLDLAGGGTHGGALVGGPHLAFQFGGGPLVLHATSRFTVAGLFVFNPTGTVNGAYGVGGGTSVFGSAMTFTPAATVTSLGEELYVYNGTADLSSGEEHTVRFATFSGGSSGGN